MFMSGEVLEFELLECMKCCVSARVLNGISL